MSASRISAAWLLASFVAWLPLAAQQPVTPAPQQTLPQQQPGPPQEPADVLPGGRVTKPRAEAPTPGFVRRDRNAVELTIAPGKTLTLRDFDYNGEPVDTARLHLREIAPGTYELSSRASTVGYWHFAVVDAAGVYGLGEHFDTLNHAHTVVHNLSMDNASTKGSSTYKPMPFFMSTTGFGLWLDTSGEAAFDVNAARPDQILVDASTDKLRVVLFSGAQPGPEQEIKMAPGRFPDILHDFMDLSATHVTLPPYWAFAPWLARDYHQNQAQVAEDVDRQRELGLPGSVILIDSPWTTAYNSYEFNPKQFDDAPAMIRHLHESGYKMVLWHTSWINLKSDTPKEIGFADKMEATSPNYKEAADEGLFVRNPDGTPWVGRWWKGEGSMIDFTNPHAKTWWQGQVHKAIAAGADGFKDDDAEGSFLGRSGSEPVIFADGTDPRLMRNRYGSLYNNAMEEVIQRDLKGNGVLFCRSVTQGANGIGFLWGGDNTADFSQANGLPSVVTAGLSAGMSGLPLWAADLGGYLKQADTPNALLLERWTEYAAFSPVMEVMSTANIVPWTFDRNSPAGTTPALDTYRRFVTLHMSLFPYRYAAAQQAAKTGMPIMRALPLLYQEDAHAVTVRDEYFFGPDLLVAPVVDENTSRVVYLPRGDWLNLFTGESITGPKTFVAQAAADQIPVYALRGAVLAKIPEDVMTLVPQAESGNSKVHTLDNRRVYEVLGDAPASGAVNAFTDFEGRAIRREGTTLAIGMPTAYLPQPDRPTHVIVRWRFTKPGAVTVNGQTMPVKADASGAASVEFDLKAAVEVKW